MKKSELLNQRLLGKSDIGINEINGKTMTNKI